MLYLSSSFVFVLLSGYWYYSAQKNSLESDTYYKLTHIADKYSGLIINAQMKGKMLHLPEEKGFEYYLLSKEEAKNHKQGYYEQGRYKVLVSAAPQEHLGVKYLLVKTAIYSQKLEQLIWNVIVTMGLSFIVIGIISILLARLFMKPVQKRVEQIENFIQDVTHELNTPITALSMSASRGIKKGVYDKNILTNIAISTKQLESIYKSLSYLNFSEELQQSEELDLAPILKQSIHYYKELSDAKKIKIEAQIQSKTLLAVESRMELLFSNLISNAIKYSMPETTIKITLDTKHFIIEDEGVGIKEEKLQEIFQLYKRDSNIAGGFGIGLSIVKQICDTYNIEVKVNSKLGVGSRFELVF